MKRQAAYQPITLPGYPPCQRKPVTLAAPFGRWARNTGDLDHDPRDSGFKLRHPLILN